MCGIGLTEAVLHIRPESTVGGSAESCGNLPTFNTVEILPCAEGLVLHMGGRPPETDVLGRVPESRGKSGICTRGRPSPMCNTAARAGKNPTRPGVTLRENGTRSAAPLPRGPRRRGLSKSAAKAPSRRSAERESLIFRASSRGRSRRETSLWQIWTRPRPGPPQEPHQHHPASARTHHRTDSDPRAGAPGEKCPMSLPGEKAHLNDSNFLSASSAGNPRARAWMLRSRRSASTEAGE